MNKRIIKPANVCDGVAGCARMLPGHAAGCTATRIHRGYCGGCGDSLHRRGSPGEGGVGRRQGGEASPRLAAWLTFNDFSNFEPSTAGVCAGGVCGRCVASMCGRCVCVCGCVFVSVLLLFFGLFQTNANANAILASAAFSLPLQPVYLSLSLPISCSLWLPSDSAYLENPFVHLAKGSNVAIRALGLVALFRF